jgi:ankyrin repeat protein
MEGGQFDLFERCHVAVYYGLRDILVRSTQWWDQRTLLLSTTPLMLACGRGHVEIVELILSHSNVDINTQNKNGATALILASQNGHDAVVKLLLSHSDVAINTQADRWWDGTHNGLPKWP